jgi:hypothetical protein
MRNTHHYGLGVRCPHENGRYTDFGWGGAAGAFLAVDMKNEISLYFASHLLSSPTQGIRSMLYRFLLAEFLDESEFERIKEDLKGLCDYNLTY